MISKDLRDLANKEDGKKKRNHTVKVFAAVLGIAAITAAAGFITGVLIFPKLEKR